MRCSFASVSETCLNSMTEITVTNLTFTDIPFIDSKNEQIIPF